MTADSDCRFCADPGTALSLASDLNELRLKHGIIWMQAGLPNSSLDSKAGSYIPSTVRASPARRERGKHLRQPANSNVRAAADCSSVAASGGCAGWAAIFQRKMVSASLIYQVADCNWITYASATSSAISAPCSPKTVIVIASASDRLLNAVP